MYKSIIIIGLILLPQLSFAQGRINADVCRAKMNGEIQNQHRIFRVVVYGQSKAEDAGIGEVRIDFIKRAWYKVAENEWRSTETDIAFNDEDMDGQTPEDPRRGIFETRGVLTSNLIPYLGQSMRALQCNLSLICNQVLLSMDRDEETVQPITVNALGCLSSQAVSLRECHFSNSKASNVDVADIQGYCEQVVEELLEQEAGILSMSISYDAAYRTVLQFAGNFDLFLQEFRLPLISTLRDAINLIGGLNRIPCFVASCDSYPPPEEPPTP